MARVRAARGLLRERLRSFGEEEGCPVMLERSFTLRVVGMGNLRDPRIVAIRDKGVKGETKERQTERDAWGGSRRLTKPRLANLK